MDEVVANVAPIDVCRVVFCNPLCVCVCVCVGERERGIQCL